MCTALKLTAANGDTVMGRTMDFSYPLPAEVRRVPAGTIWSGQADGRRFTAKYGFEGAAGEAPVWIFADGVNEAGLAVAALYFPEYVSYDEKAENGGGQMQLQLASTDVTQYLLSTCKNVEEAIEVFRTARIIGTKDTVTGIVAPLHWMVCDRAGGCITAEKMAEGTFVYENRIGVLANAPDFSWHMTNLRNYMNVVPEQQAEVIWKDGIHLTPFGQGGGTIGLPGDYTSPGRFARVAWLASHADAPEDGDAAMKLAFQILGNVSIPKGCVMTHRGTPDVTQYTICFHLGSGTVEIT